MMSALAIQLEPMSSKQDAHKIEQMACAIARLLQQKHSCSIDDLLAEKFSQEDINRFWGAANDLAAKKRPRPSWR